MSGYITSHECFTGEGRGPYTLEGRPYENDC